MWNYLLRCDEGMTKTSVIINTFCGAVCSCGVFLLPWCVTSLAGKLLQVAEFVFCPQSWATIKVHQIPFRPTSCVGIFFFNWGISWLLLGWKFFKCGIRVRGNKLWMIRNVPNYDVVQIQNGPKKKKNTDYTASALKNMEMEWTIFVSFSLVMFPWCWLPSWLLTGTLLYDYSGAEPRGAVDSP